MLGFGVLKFPLPLLLFKGWLSSWLSISFFLIIFAKVAFFVSLGFFSGKSSYLLEEVGGS